jgi:S1-C subfamily serine protease
MTHRTSLLVVGLVALPGAVLANHEESSSTLSLDTTVKEVRGWTIGTNQSFNGCWIKATYKDQTTVWMGYGGGDRQAYVAFTNPNWQSIGPGQKYALGILAQGQGNWRSQFTGVEAPDGEKGIIGGPLKEGFMDAMAHAGGVTVSLGQTTVARLSLTGSSAALESAMNCHAAYQEARGGDGSGTDEGGGTEEEGAVPAARRGPQPKKGVGSSGTGFFVTAQGHVMTNSHVIDGCRTARIVPPGQPPVAATVIAKDSTNDLAVLRADYEPFAIAPLNPRVRIGESVYTYGYPLSSYLASTGNFTGGLITATAGMQDNSSELQISAPVHKGNSGGALMDQYGNAVGVIVKKLDYRYALVKSDDLPQNVNFAIKASVALNFLESNNIPITTVTKTTPKDAATLAEDAKKFTVRVICW